MIDLLEFNDFLQVVKCAPLVSIDLVVQNESGQFLLGLRLNEPAKGNWFVPGGRVFKSETLDMAFARIATSELGIRYAREDATSMGVYEHFYETNAGSQQDFGTHYVVLAHQLAVKQSELRLPENEQHRAWRWCGAEEILQDSNVNLYTKNYFQITD